MINYYDFLRVIQDSATEKDKYNFAPYGPNVVIEEWWNQKHDGGYSISVVYDSRTMFVFEMEAWDYDAEREYRWISPNYRIAQATERANRLYGATGSIDGREYIDLEVAEDMLEKAAAMFKGEEYDTRISIPVDLPDEMMFNVMKMAHEADMTLNQFVERVLRADLEAQIKEKLKEQEQQ